MKTDDEIIKIFEENEKNYREMRPLKLAVTIDLKQYETTKDFINWVINKGVYEHVTVYADIENLDVSNREHIQCYPNKNRSLQDLFCIISFYKPEITLLDLTMDLVTLLKENKISCLHCPHISRRVWHYNSCRNPIYLENEMERMGYDREHKSMETETDNISYLDIKQIYDTKYSKEEVRVESVCAAEAV